MLRHFHALPTEDRVRRLTDGDYLYCALNLLLDQEEQLDRLCPQCRSEAEDGRCPSCGSLWNGSGAGRNAAFDEERYEALRRGEMK